MDWLDSAWSNYVVELDCQRQRDAIYQPIAKAAHEPVAGGDQSPAVAGDVQLAHGRAST